MITRYAAALVAATLIITPAAAGTITDQLCQGSQWKQKRPGHADVETPRLFACGTSKHHKPGKWHPKPPNPVPIPASALLFAAGMAGVAWMARRKRA